MHVKPLSESEKMALNQRGQKIKELQDKGILDLEILPEKKVCLWIITKL